jgi:PAS domain S-box-containing protein
MTNTEIRRSEAQFRGAFESSAIAHAVVAPDGQWVWANLALSRLLGRTIEQLREMSSYDLTHPDDLPAYREHVQKLLSGEIASFDMEKRYLHDGGEIIHVREVVSLITRSAESHPQLFAQILDLTERKRDQAQIDELRRELIWFGRIATMGQLTAALAHELTQPLTAILSNAEALQRRMLDGSIENNRVQSYLEDIIGGGIRAGEIINRVRGLLTRERQSRTRLDLNRLLLDVSRVLRSDLVARGVHLTLRLHPGALWIEADSVEVQQIILNLLVNGADASVDAVRRELIVATNEGSEAVLEVRDFGRGVHPTSLRRLFEPFFTTKPHGMGMGLAICAELARAHGGRLQAENNADCGMTFRLSLPIAPPAGGAG